MWVNTQIQGSHVKQVHWYKARSQKKGDIDFFSFFTRYDQIDPHSFLYRISTLSFGCN